MLSHRLFFALLWAFFLGGADVGGFAANPAARLAVGPDGLLQVEGWTRPVPPSAVEASPGPLPGIEGFRAVAIGRLDLRRPLAKAGALTFWFHLDRAYPNGRGVKPSRLSILDVPDAFEVSIIGESNAQTLFIEWRGDPKKMFDQHIRMVLPELPGPAWYHLAIAWDGSQGRMGAWLNGTAYFLPGGHVSPWTPGTAAALVFPPEGPPLAEIQFWNRALTDAEARTLVPPAFRGSADRLLGSADLGLLPWKADERARIAAFSFATEADLGGWRAEGPLIARVREGWLEMKSREPDGPQGHTVFWCPQALPASFAAAWDFQIVSPTGLCIVFFSAHAPGRASIFDPALRPRTGVFEQYVNGDIATYHISYFATTPSSPRSMANLRKDPGFYLLSNGPIRVEPDANRTYHATLLKTGRHIQMAIDGRLIIDYDDDSTGRFGSPYEGGLFGLRQMRWTAARYRNLRFYAVPLPR